jgi:hypothetical protein
MIIAIDPGKTSGWAVFTGDGNLVEVQQGDAKTLHSFLSQFEDTYGSEPTTVVIEEYIILPTKRGLQANVGTKGETMQIIGLIKSFTLGWNCTVVMQPPNIKKLTSMQTGVKVPTNHKFSHGADAILHGYHYFIKNGIMTFDAEAVRRSLA